MAEVGLAPSKETEEADEGEGEEADETASQKELLERDAEEVDDEIGDEEDEDKDEDGEATEAEPPTEGEEVVDYHAATPLAPKKRKLINQFNFCERASLTYTYPKRVIYLYKSIYT